MPDFETEEETDAWIRCLSKRGADGCMERSSQRDTQREWHLPTQEIQKNVDSDQEEGHKEEEEEEWYSRGIRSQELARRCSDNGGGLYAERM